jgi:hypothetical protein
MRFSGGKGAQGKGKARGREAKGQSEKVEK